MSCHFLTPILSPLGEQSQFSGYSSTPIESVFIKVINGSLMSIPLHKRGHQNPRRWQWDHNHEPSLPEGASAVNHCDVPTDYQSRQTSTWLHFQPARSLWLTNLELNNSSVKSTYWSSRETIKFLRTTMAGSQLETEATGIWHLCPLQASVSMLTRMHTHARAHTLKNNKKKTYLKKILNAGDLA